MRVRKRVEGEFVFSFRYFSLEFLFFYAGGLERLLKWVFGFTLAVFFQRLKRYFLGFFSLDELLYCAFSSELLKSVGSALDWGRVLLLESAIFLWRFFM